MRVWQASIISAKVVDQRECKVIHSRISHISQLIVIFRTHITIEN